MGALAQRVNKPQAIGVANTVDMRGRGSVDVALQCSTAVAHYLKRGGAVEQLPNPATASGQDAEDRKRRRGWDWTQGYWAGERASGWSWTRSDGWSWSKPTW